jgi:hypothetical protein
MVTGNISGVPVIAIYQSLLRTTAFDTIHQNVTRAIICVQLDMELYSRTESGESKLLADDAGVHHLEHIIADGPPGVSNADKHPSFTTQYHGTRFTVSAHRWRVIQGGDFHKGYQEGSQIQRPGQLHASDLKDKIAGAEGHAARGGTPASLNSTN